MEVEVTPYDAVKLSWKLMQGVHKKDLIVRPHHFCALANSLQITVQNWPHAKSMRTHSTYERLFIQKRCIDDGKSQVCTNKCNF